MKLDIADLSPLTARPDPAQTKPKSKLKPIVNQVQKQRENLNIAQAMESIWSEKTTQYFGEHEIATRSVSNKLIQVDTYHVFYNQFSFLHLE